MLRLSQVNPLELVESQQEILHSLLKLCVGEPTISKLTKVLKLSQSPFYQLYFLEKAQEIIGLIGIKWESKVLTLQHIAIKKEFQNQGFGAKSIELIAWLYKPEVIEVETDDDSLGFYIKAGFKVKEAQEQSFFSKRYVCQKIFKKN